VNEIRKAIDFIVKIAKDDSHGYDQGNRSGNPDYDCSSLVIASWEAAGVPVKKNGATFTGNMRPAFLKTGFIDVIKQVNLKNCKGMEPGDVLLTENKHTALYIGDSQMVHASLNEFGKIVGGKPGDQTEKEICVRSYYNYPWGSVLRYIEQQLTFEQALDILAQRSGINKDYWLARKNIDPYFAELMIKVAK
jgi:cell wall-associated NlpC family hydrolase